VEAREEGVVVEGEEVGREPHFFLLRSNSLGAKRIAPWPLYFVFAPAIGANGDLRNFLSHSGGSDNSHPPFAVFAAKHFLQGSSSPERLGWEVPSWPVFLTFAGGFLPATGLRNYNTPDDSGHPREGVFPRMVFRASWRVSKIREGPIASVR